MHFLPELSKSHLALGRFKVSLLIDFLYSLIIMLKKITSVDLVRWRMCNITQML